MSYRRFLVPVDHAGCAQLVVAHATRLARPFQAEVILLAVVQPPSGVHFSDASHGRTVAERLDAEATEALHELRDTFGAGLTVRVEVRHGPVVPTILAAREEYRPDMLVMGTHGRTGLRRVMLGSVAEEVLRQCEIPVLIVHAPKGMADAPSEAWRDIAREADG